MKYIIPLLLLFYLLLSCNSPQGQNKHSEDGESPVSNNGIYFWKSQFKLNDSEIQFLEKHEISRLYVKMFDVALQTDSQEDTLALVPIATTRFVTPIPNDLEVIPVVYITYESIAHLRNKESSYIESYAKRIITRIDAMMSFNGISNIKELQLDCDWTSSTYTAYNNLCYSVRRLLKIKGIQLSITLRLHQMDDINIPNADRGVLMLYNTGSFKNPDCINSILSYADAAPYLKKHKIPFPVDYAYPTYSWSLLYRNNEFKSIVRNIDLKDSLMFIKSDFNKYVVQKDTIINLMQFNKGDVVRHETSEFREIERVKSDLSRRHNMMDSRQIIYHLDSANLSNYTDDEIKYMLISY